MKVYILTRIFNRDDQCEVIADQSCYVNEILGVFASKESAEQGAMAAKKKFFDGFAYNHDIEDPESIEDDIVYQQANDDDLEVYAEDYDYGGTWGEFYVYWDIKAYELQGSPDADGFDPAE